MPSFFFHIAIDLAASSPSLNNFPRSGIFDRVVPKHKTSNLRAAAKDFVARPPAEQTRPSPSTNPEAVSHGIKNQIQDIAPEPRSQNPPSPISPASHTDDWRVGRIALQVIDMLSTASGERLQKGGTADVHISNGIGAGPGGLATKGRFEPSDVEEEDIGWGVVRLYRDSEETPGLYDDVPPVKSLKHGKHSRLGQLDQDPPFRNEDCTTLCILAVPSYLTPSDFLGFVGDETRDEVSHFRMIRTERVNRYMVLMKFRNGRKAREWRKEWNGKAFNPMEPEHCHVVFVKSIEFRVLESTGQEPSFPDMTNDPFTPAIANSGTATAKVPSSSTASATLSTKPMAPPTPALVEMPTCPVCLERMDESTGLLTILCQHVFHCSCLQKWKGSGCPVCRYTHDGFGKRIHCDPHETGLNECTICSSDENLWICLICGNVGCGRYSAAHAFLHYQQTTHCFAMDLATQRVWDYASDGYVHRIVQSKTDGKLVELPANTVLSRDGDPTADDDAFVPREKIDAIGLEYTHLLTSQLDSQRLYFEQKLELAADRASRAASAATAAAEASERALAQLATLQTTHDALAQTAIPALERDRDRAGRRADKFEGMARKLEREWREEKTVSTSLMERIRWLEGEVSVAREREQAATGQVAELEEENRDLGFFISGKERLEGLGLGEEVRDSVVSLPEERAVAGKGKGKGKGKGRGTGKSGGKKTAAEDTAEAQVEVGEQA